MVTFIEKTHQYFNEKGIEYNSATGVLHSIQPKFDENLMASKYALKINKSVEEVLDMWHKKRDLACEVGTKYHKIMEDHILRTRCNQFSIDDDDPIYDQMKNDFDNLMKEKARDNDIFHSEYLLWHDDSRIAGTADLIIDHANTNEFSVGDFKTNEKIQFSNAFGETFISPFSHLSSCNYNTYSMQLSLYAYMYSKLTGKTCRQVFLMWIDRANNGKINFIPANYLYSDISTLISIRQQELNATR